MIEFSPQWFEQKKREEIKEEVYKKILKEYSFGTSALNITLSYTIPKDLKEELEELYLDAGWDIVSIDEEYMGFYYTSIYLEKKGEKYDK